MNQDTKTKFAAILAAAQAKTAQQVSVKPAQPEVKEYDNLKDIETAAKSGEVISILNLSNLVNEDKKTAFPFRQPTNFTALQPELSTITFDDLITPEPKKPAFSIIDYSDKSFAIVTKEKPAEDILNIFRLHGTYNSHLKCGKGWIFSKRHLETVKAKLSI